jgi:hypothetical protein
VLFLHILLISNILNTFLEEHRESKLRLKLTDFPKTSQSQKSPSQNSLKRISQSLWKNRDTRTHIYHPRRKMGPRHLKVIRLHRKSIKTLTTTLQIEKLALSIDISSISCKTDHINIKVPKIKKKEDKDSFLILKFMFVPHLETQKFW